MTRDAPGPDAPDRATGPGPARTDRLGLLGLAAIAAIAIAAAITLGSPVTQIAVILIALATFHGAVIGAAETAAIIVSLLLAALLAQPLGRALEGLVGETLGLTGLMKRGAAFGAAALLVLVVASLVLGAIARRLVRGRRRGAGLNRALGALLGLAEGSLLALLVLWGLLAIEPVAQRRLQPAPGGGPPNASAASLAIAERVVSIVESADRAVLGRLAAATNPIAQAPIFTLADDFVLVTSDPEARRAFYESDAVRQLQEHPAIRRAAEQLRQDPDVRAVLERGLDREGLLVILESDAVLRVLDEIDLATEFGPMTEPLRAALEDAKARIHQR